MKPSSQPQKLLPKVSELRGFKQLGHVAGLLQAVHQEGCSRDKAGNRELHFDDYVLLVLLFLFNPMIDSMLQLQRMADLETVQKKLGIRRFSLNCPAIAAPPAAAPSMQ